MDSKFNPPQTDAEFAERAKDVTLQAARSILNGLKNRRRALVENINAEINFYERVVKAKETEPLPGQTSLVD